ncbi:MAG: STAS domain-containing protein [Marmoricola sp.]
MEHASEDGTVSTALVLSGALDVRRTADLRAEVYDLLARTTGDVVVDVTRVDSIDIITLKMLAVANRTAERQARQVVLRGASPGVRRLLHLSHMRWMIPLEPLEPSDQLAATPPPDPPSPRSTV